MHTWIALIRGINVGGKNILPMNELVRDLKSLKLENVRTYIQSGNAVFQSPRAISDRFAETIAEQIEKRHSFKPRVLILSADELQIAITQNPFPVAEPDSRKLHLFFLSSVALAPDIKSLSDARSPSERFELIDRVFYLHAPDGIGRSKLAANVEKYLGVPGTARNWRTVQRLSEMTKEL